MFLASTSKDFESMAASIADQFFSADNMKSLSQLVADKAKAEGLNPMEIQRLVEKSNTVAVLKILESNPKAEIDLANYSQVMKLVYAANEATSEADASAPAASVADLPDTRSAAKVKDVEISPASEQPETKVASETKQNLQSEYFHLELQRQKLAQEKLAVELRIQDQLDSLLSQFSSYYAPDFQKFASEAYTLHGDVAKPVLEALAKSLRESCEFVKTAHVVDDTTSEHAVFKSVLADLKSLVKVASIYESTNARYQEVVDALRGLV